MMLTCQNNIIKCSAAASKKSDYVFAGFSQKDYHITIKKR